MNEELFSVGAAEENVKKIVEKIQANVRQKIADGIYTDGDVAKAERTNLTNLQKEEDFLSFYLECLRESVFVDINDFEIIERRATFSGLLVSLKKTIWKLLKFYTYRLWSQQNQVNGLILSAVEASENRYRDKIKELEKRIENLEQASRK